MMKKLLVVDDHKLTREKIISILRDGNYAIGSTDNGYEALQILKKEVVDLIITDIIMPKMEGVEFIGAIKREFPKVKIIAVSSYKPFYLKIAKEMGADAICEKRNVTQDLLGIASNLINN